jgi:hypothetical protein
MTLSPERLLNVAPPLLRNPSTLLSLPFRNLHAESGDA